MATIENATKMHDVFISYSPKDKTWATDICSFLENVGLRCWIAPRDVRPRAEWSQAILDGIDECRVVVVIFSHHANESHPVLREIELAVNKSKPVVSFRVDNALPSASMQYFVGASHWIDRDDDSEQVPTRLVEKVRSLLTSRAVREKQPTEPHKSIT